MQRWSRRRFATVAAAAVSTVAATPLLWACSDQERDEGGAGADTLAGEDPADTDEDDEPGTAEGAGSETESVGDTVDLVRYAWWTDVGNMTPFQMSPTGPGGVVLLSLIFDSLTWKDEEGLIPLLSSSWEASEDGTKFTFQIVEGATWHDWGARHAVRRSLFL